MEKILVKHFGKCQRLPWMVEFHSNEEGTVLNNQLSAAFASTYIDHLSKLDPTSKLNPHRLTQIACVVPTHPSDIIILGLLEMGMNIAVIKMGFVTIDSCRDNIKLIQDTVIQFSKKIGRIYPLAIAMELSEPAILTGKLIPGLEEIQLTKGEKTKITTDPYFANRTSKDYIYVNYEKISDVVKPGDIISLGKGSQTINLEALEVARDILKCIVERAGVLIDNLPVNLPNGVIPVPPVSSQDHFLRLGAELKIDMAFVGMNSIDMAKAILGPSAMVFVKVEKLQDIDKFDIALEKIDGVLIDSECVLVSLKENTFILQKCITAKCNKIGKPVITQFYTQNSRELTKSEIFDIANAVIDGCDAILIPAFTAVLHSAGLVCKAAEAAAYQKQIMANMAVTDQPPIEPIYATALSTVEASLKSNAAAIIVLTTSGRSAKVMSKYRPRCPIIAVTRYLRIAKQLHVCRALLPVFYVKKSETTWDEDVNQRVQLGVTFGKYAGLIRAGDAVVIVNGSRPGAGFTNTLRVVFASEIDTPKQDK